MTQSLPILVATSIAPHTRLETQTSAIASWQRQGLDVVSLNARDEIDTLAPQFAGVSFVAVERTGKLLTGRHHVFLDDILRYLAYCERSVVGIVNSDIQFDASRPFPAIISERAIAGLVCCPRLDVASPSESEGIADPFGFDSFFFSPAASSLWLNTRFCLGQGYWDHWLPLMAILRGHPTYKLTPALGRHAAHEIKRDDSFFIFADEFAALATGFMRDSQDNEPMDLTQFGMGFPKRAYAELRQKAEDGRADSVEKFARFIDELTRYVIRFIDANSRRLPL